MKTIAQQLGIKEFPFEIKDKHGNKIYFENSYGYWWKRKFDSQSNRLYYENSYGYWEKREFDFQGNEVYYEESDGFWWRGEYDSQGNMIYYESSGGEVIDNRTIPEYTMEQLVEKLGNFKIKK